MDTGYEAKASQSFTAFEFVSEGPKGRITKIVQYRKRGGDGYFNLGFGDYDAANDQISDTIVTNNDDSKKVLETVASTLYIFLKHHPEAFVFAKGSTASRTRLYRMGITKNLEAIQRDFTVWGWTESGWQPFQKGITYEAFLVHLNTIALHI